MHMESSSHIDTHAQSQPHTSIRIWEYPQMGRTVYTAKEAFCVCIRGYNHNFLREEPYEELYESTELLLKECR